jgi:NADH-quinone oxidoreductase subunit L
MALTPVLAKVSPKARDYGAVLFAVVAAIAALSLLPLLFHPDSLPLESKVAWLTSPMVISFGVLIDPLSIIIVNVVAVISSIIMIYCMGYMKGDPAQTRFWMWMNAFIGSMVLLVLANNLLFLFVGWKLVGVCSYGLIGFYYKDERKYWIGGPTPNKFVTPSSACIKALVVTGVGDMLMLAGILIMYAYSGTLNISELYATCHVWLPQMAERPGLLVLLSLLLVAGPLGKSAQFPFHEWLPEAMAGPGPVSALIHAATMVKSGVYLVARLLPIFYYSYWVADCPEAGTFFHVVAWAGAFTAFLAATQGMVAIELKKILAYSTVSQIGYMMLGLGVAGMSQEILVEGYTAGVAHLVSHAMFKACLFLCAGTVIHAVHSIYITDMGSMKKHLPKTWICMIIASASLVGFPYITPGFYSKEEVLHATLSVSPTLFALGLVTAGLTAFYTVRFMGIVFWGKPTENVKHAEHAGGHMNDGHPSMWVAVGILAVALIFMGALGPLFLTPALHHGFENNLVQGLSLPVIHGVEHHFSPWIFPGLPLAFFAIGVILAYRLYISRTLSAEKWLAKDRGLKDAYLFFWKRWYIDDFYNRVFVDGTLKLSRFVADGLEEKYDTWIHTKFPKAFVTKPYEALKELQLDNRQVLYNVSYILGFFALLLIVFFRLLGD